MLLMESLLNNEKVRMRDPTEVERKLNVLINSGKENLLVITDFDYTLTRYRDSLGGVCWTTYGVLDAAAATMSPQLENIFERLKSKYQPIEYDPHMSIMEKIPHMEEWWRTSHNYIIEAGFTKQIIKKFVADPRLQLRDGAEQLVCLLRDEQLPLVIFSAGIGYIIESFLERMFGQVPENVHIISNMMSFNENDVVVGFSEPLIHAFCKNSNAINHKGSLYHQIKSRKNVLLLGDGVGDANMDIGLEGEQVALKIGFLNFNQDALYEKYANTFDIVLTDDQTMDVPQLILSFIANGATKEENNENDLSNRSSCRAEVAETESELGKEKSKKPVEIEAKVPA